MTGARMAAVEPDGVTDAQPLHAAGKVRVTGFDHEMKMVFHQDIGMQAPTETGDRFSKQFGSAGNRADRERSAAVRFRAR